jgi:predicted RND superfamily exporter protein
VAAILVGRGVPCGVVVVALTVLLGSFAARAPVEQSNASMNARNEARNAAYADYRRTFGNDEIVLLAVTHPHLLSAEGLRLVDEITTAAAAIDGVARAESLTSVRQLVHGEFGAEDAPLVERPFDRPGVSDEIARALDRNPWLSGLLVSADRRTAGIALEIEDIPGDDLYRGRAIEALRTLARSRAGHGVRLHLTGITVQKHDVARFVEADRRRVLPLSAGVLALALWLIFRRWSGVLLPLATTLVAVAWTLGLYAALGYSVNVITSLLPPVIMVLSISTGVHLYEAWLDPAPAHASRREMASATLRAKLVPSFLTALTTALGLVSLAVSEIPAVRQFGIFAAAGVMISFLLNVTLLPLGFATLAPPDPRKRPARGRRARLLDRLARLSIGRPVAILSLAACVSLVSLAGIASIRNNTDLVRFLHRDSRLYRDTMFIDRNLAGVNALELVVRRADGAPLTSVGDVRRLAAFQDEIRRLEDVGAVLGLADLVAQVHRAEEDLPQARLPDDADDLLYCFDLLEASDDPRIGRLITPDLTAAHLTVRVRAVGTSRAQVLIDRILAAAGSELGNAYELLPTGAFYNVTMDSNRLVSSQVKSLSLALVTVLLALAAVFRSLKLLLAALIPNLLPILWTGGLMGATGIDLSSGTAMIASVVLGIAVDGTIHYLARFRREHLGDPAAAVRATTSATGRALIGASVVLALGFWVGALGSFRPTIHFSVLTGLAILGALVCDLLVLPACLVLVRPRARGR